MAIKQRVREYEREGNGSIGSLAKRNFTTAVLLHSHNLEYRAVSEMQSSSYQEWHSPLHLISRTQSRDSTILSRYPYSLLTLWTALFLLGTISVELGGIQWYDDSMRLIYSHVGAQRPLYTASGATSSDIEDEPYARNFIQAR